MYFNSGTTAYDGFVGPRQALHPRADSKETCRSILGVPCCVSPPYHEESGGPGVALSQVQPPADDGGAKEQIGYRCNSVLAKIWGFPKVGALFFEGSFQREGFYTIWAGIKRVLLDWECPCCDIWYSQYQSVLARRASTTLPGSRRPVLHLAVISLIVSMRLWVGLLQKPKPETQNPKP